MTKEDAWFRNWRGWLIKYLAENGDDIANYDDEVVRDLFANGLTIKEAARELKSELKKQKTN